MASEDEQRSAAGSGGPAWKGVASPPPGGDPREGEATSEPEVSLEMQRLRRIAGTLGVPVTRRHVFLCADQSNPKCCGLERGLEAWEYLKRRLRELGLSEQGGVFRTKANCLRVCEGGPIAVVYPEGAWYARCDPPVLERIIREHLLGGRVVEEFLIARQPLEPALPDPV